MTAPATRLLLVEDDPDILAVARLALTTVGGFDVCACASGTQALELAPGFRPELMVLDVMMPGLDGPATLLRLRNIPHLETLPVVFLTAHTEAAEQARLLALGARAVLPKPFDPMELPTLCRAALEASDV